MRHAPPIETDVTEYRVLPKPVAVSIHQKYKAAITSICSEFSIIHSNNCVANTHREELFAGAIPNKVTQKWERGFLLRVVTDCSFVIYKSGQQKTKRPAGKLGNAFFGKPSLMIAVSEAVQKT